MVVAHRETRRVLPVQPEDRDEAAPEDQGEARADLVLDVARLRAGTGRLPGEAGGARQEQRPRRDRDPRVRRARPGRVPDLDPEPERRPRGEERARHGPAAAGLPGAREFTSGATLYAQFSVYGAEKDKGSSMPRVSASYDIMDADGVPRARMKPTVINPTSLGKLSRLVGTVLEGYEPGSYEFVLNIKDEVTGKTLQVREAFTVVAPAAASTAAARPARRRPSPPGAPRTLRPGPSTRMGRLSQAPRLLHPRPSRRGAAREAEGASLLVWDELALGSDERDAHRRGRDGVGEGLGPAASDRRPVVSRARHLEGRLALVVRRDLPLLHGPVDAFRPPDRDAFTACSNARRRRRSRWTACRASRPSCSGEPAWCAESCSTVPRQIPRVPVALRTLKASLASRANTVKTLATVVKAHLSGRPPERVASHPRILFLSHAAFWRDGKEHYFDRLLPEVETDPSFEACVIGVGPKAPVPRS